MPYFQIMLSGDGISFSLEGRSDLVTGFFTTRFVKADNVARAKELAMELVLSEWRQGGGYAAANQGVIPQLAIERALPVSTLTGIFRRKAAGYSFYLSD